MRKINQNRNHRDRLHRFHLSLSQTRRLSLKAIQSAPDVNRMSLVLGEIPICPLSNLETVWVVIKRKPITEIPRLYRWLARFVYFRVGWASDYSTELIGVYTDKGDAYRAALAPGYAMMEVTLNTCLPDETCQFRCHEFPLAGRDTRYRYQHRKLDLVAVPRMHLQALIAVTNDVTAPKNGKQ